MYPRVTITPELREWILATTRAGHGVDDVLRLMKENGYDPRQSRSIVAEVMKLPLAALHATTGKPQGLRTRHPEAPEVVVDGRTIGIPVSVDAPAGLDVAVDPPSFSFDGSGASGDTVFRSGFDAEVTQTIAVTATTDPSLAGPQFADIVFHEANGLAPDAHMPVAVLGSSDPGGGAFGVTCSDGACTFRIDVYSSDFLVAGCPTYCPLLWLNRFTPDPADYPITITSISTIFANGAGWNAEGDHVNVYVYQDDDTDPADGATLIGAYQGYAMPVPINQFTEIALPTPIVVAVMLGGGGGDVRRVGAFPADANPALATLSAAIVAYYSFVGFETSANVAEEVREPRRVYPKALFGALATAGVVYVLVGLASATALPASALEDSSGPLLAVVSASGRSAPRMNAISASALGWIARAGSRRPPSTTRMSSNSTPKSG